MNRANAWFATGFTVANLAIGVAWMTQSEWVFAGLWTALALGWGVMARLYFRVLRQERETDAFFGYTVTHESKGTF